MSGDGSIPTAAQMRSRAVSRIIEITRRHRGSDGLCRSCYQPWPCDVEILRRILAREKEET